MVEILGAVIAFVGLWGSLWYKLGKIETEVKGHNSRLDKLEKILTNFLERGGIRNG